MRELRFGDTVRLLTDLQGEGRDKAFTSAYDGRIAEVFGGPFLTRIVVHVTGRTSLPVDSPLSSDQASAASPKALPPRCGNCRFAVSGLATVWCRRRAPGRKGFPETAVEQWCGEHEPK